ncbi:MAG: hypothetical protein ACTSQ8_16025, partial [Candidatus Helarchaeota archaeon]
KGAKLIITTQTTTTMLEDVVNKFPGAELIRVQNVPGSVANTIRIRRADFGGSDTGKVRFPEYAYFSDTTLATLKLLEIIARKKKTMTQLLAEVPQTTKRYEEIACDARTLKNFHGILEENLRDLKTIDTLIGIKIFFGPKLGWVHVIPSFSEQKIILCGETVNPAKARELFKTIEYVIEGKLTKPPVD